MANALDHRPDLDEPRDTGRSWDDEFNKIADPHSNWAAQVAKQAEEDQAKQQVESGDDSLDVKNREEQPSGQFPYEQTGVNRRVDPNISRARKIVGLAKKRGGVIGLITMFGLGGGLLAGFFGPATMLINISENLIQNNDSSSTVMERRFMKAFGFATAGDPNCVSTKMKCKMGRISNSALTKLQKKGVTPVFEDGSKGVTKRSGYPGRNPTSYDFDVGTGNPKNVTAAELPEFLSQRENRALAAKLLGTGGAFNMRFRAWSGKYLSKKLFTPMQIKRNGGVTSKENKGMSTTERKEKLKAEISTKARASAGTVSTNVGNTTEKTMKGAKKGGVGYMLAVGGCMGVKAPKIVAGAIAAVQLAQILPIVMDLVLSPGSNAKGSLETEFTAEDAEAAGTILTSTTPRESDGKLTSALDSAILLSALGVLTNKVPIPQDIVPGYAAFNNSAVKAASQLEDGSEEACNVIMSPAAMYTAMAADAAVTVAASATIIGGIIKVAASVIVAEIAQRAAVAMVEDLAEHALTAVANNDIIETAEGEELGDVIGVSAISFFSTGALSRMIPALTVNQQVAFNQIKQENEQFKKEMDVASLSPLDTSSRHTFLGNIVHNMSTAMIANNSYNNSFASIASNLLKIPAIALSPLQVSAGSNSSNSCDYADEYGLSVETNSHNMKPAINLAGMPCTGITPEQDSISTDEAYDLLENEGWIDDNVEVENWETIDDLVEQGYIVEDNPLYDFIQTCGNPTSGDYLFNSAGCVIGSETGSLDQVNSSMSGECYEIETEEGTSSVCASDSDASSEMPELKNPRSLLAISVFLIDMQIIQSINGEDDEEISGGTDSTSSDDNPTIIDTPSKEGWSHPLPGARVSSDYRANNSKGIHKGIDFSYGAGNNDGKPVYAAHDGVVTSQWNMGSCGWATVISAEGVNGIWHAYQHMDPIAKEGDTVKRGQQIGVIGRFCGSGKHLHFSIETENRVSPYVGRDTSRNPRDYLPL